MIKINNKKNIRSSQAGLTRETCNLTLDIEIISQNDGIIKNKL